MASSTNTASGGAVRIGDKVLVGVGAHTSTDDADRIAARIRADAGAGDVLVLRGVNAIAFVELD
jgi:hypothetical protein